MFGVSPSRRLVFRVVNLSAFPLSGVFDISREITRVARNTRGTWYQLTKNRKADVDIADILGVAEANVLMLLVIFNLTLGII